MQFLQGTESHAPVATGGRMLGAPDAGRVLGDFTVRIFDRDDGVRFSLRHQYVAAARLGAREGYATLGAALEHLGTLTAREAPAAAVLRREGRYWGHVLKGRELDRGYRAPLELVHLEPDEREQVLGLRASDRYDGLAAVVDGEWRHRFRGR